MQAWHPLPLTLVTQVAPGVIWTQTPKGTLDKKGEKTGERSWRAESRVTSGPEKQQGQNSRPPWDMYRDSTCFLGGDEGGETGFC